MDATQELAGNLKLQTRLDDLTEDSSTLRTKPLLYAVLKEGTLFTYSDDKVRRTAHVRHVCASVPLLRVQAGRNSSAGTLCRVCVCASSGATRWCSTAARYASPTRPTGAPRATALSCRIPIAYVGRHRGCMWLSAGLRRGGGGGGGVADAIVCVCVWSPPPHWREQVLLFTPDPTGAGPPTPHKSCRLYFENGKELEEWYYALRRAVLLAVNVRHESAMPCDGAPTLCLALIHSLAHTLARTHTVRR